MNNEEALGYMLLAAKSEGLDKKTTIRMYYNMYGCFDLHTEDEAAEHEKKWYREEGD